MNTKLLACAFSVLTFAVVTAMAGEAVPSVNEIVASSNRVAYYQGKDGRADVAMTIRDSAGRERSRLFTILRKDVEPEGDTSDKVCADQKFYVYFHRPADVNKTTFLVWKSVTKDDNRWLYLPALDLVKPIAAGDKRTSFVGSHFYYEDVSGRNINDDTHELIKTTESAYLLKNTPKSTDGVEFAYYNVWIHRQTFLPFQIEYYDVQGKKYREIKALEVKEIDGFPTVTRSVVKDLRTGGETEMKYTNVKYNIGLPDDIFSERYLRNAPRQYLR